MLEIRLNTDYFEASRGKEWLKVEFKAGIMPCAVFEYHKPQEMLPIDDLYTSLVAEGLSEEAIIDRLLKDYMPVEYFQIKYLAHLVKVIGLVGNRGSGKTASAVNIVIFDWLLKGKPVYSNIDIDVRVSYRDASKEFHSQPLGGLDIFKMDKYNIGGCVLIDEINMTVAEGKRSMSGANLEFSYRMQQIRKNQLSVVWTCQGWGWVDDRVRWQTDYVVGTQDCFIRHEHGAKCPGDKSMWRVMELSGLSGKYDTTYETRHRYLSEYVIWNNWIWNRVVWDAFDTYKTQGEGDYIAEFRAEKQGIDADRRYQLVEARQEPARDFVERLVEANITMVMADDIWQTNNITGKAEQMRIAEELKKRGYLHKRNSAGKYFYELKEKNAS